MSVHTIVFNTTKTEILLIKRRDVPVWVLPGGGIDPEESPEQAALRELFEETGFQGEILRKVGEYTPLCKLATFAHLFECRLLSGEPTLSHETRAIQFFPLSALPKKIPPPYLDWIQDALLNTSQVLKKEISSVTYPALVKHLMLHPLLVMRFLLAKMGLSMNF